MQKIRTGVVGLGAIGANHARIMAELPNAEFAAVYDERAEHAQELAARYGVAAAASLDELISMVDAATVATPTVSHLAVGRALLEAGKHVLIEKPIADNSEDAKALVDLAESRGLVLQVGHIERFNPVLGQLETFLTSPRFIESHRLSPFPNRSIDIGVVLDLMIHDIEIILHLVRSEIESIDAVGVPVLTRREDIANARIRFANGCVANITASRISPERLRKIRVFQGDSYVSLDYQAQAGELFRKQGMEIVREAVTVEKDEPLKLELAAFVDCATHGFQPRVSGSEAAAALKVAIEITRMIEAAGANPMG